MIENGHNSAVCSAIFDIKFVVIKVAVLLDADFFAPFCFFFALSIRIQEPNVEKGRIFPIGIVLALFRTFKAVPVDPFTVTAIIVMPVFVEAALRVFVAIQPILAKKIVVGRRVKDRSIGHSVPKRWSAQSLLEGSISNCNRNDIVRAFGIFKY